MEAKREPLLRIYDSLKNFLGENKVHKSGDVLYISTKDNGYYDIIVTADGRSTFRELLKDYNYEDEYSVVMVKKESLENGGV